MRLISIQNGTLVDAERPLGSERRSFLTSLDDWDALAPPGGFARGAVHELLGDPASPLPLTPAVALARAALRSDTPDRQIVFVDPQGLLHPPALRAWDIPLARVLILRPRSDDETLWSITECLRSSAVSAVVARPPVLSRLEARRLQLAAETGGGVGVLLRAHDRTAVHFAAATRWRVTPTPGQRLLQRWKMQRIHGHGRSPHDVCWLELDRENHLLRATRELPGRSAAPATPTRWIA
jgi:protein ImuA